MISLNDFYDVISAVIPLYVAMMLAYGSVRWWKILTPDQCSGINRFVALFAVPLLSFQIIARQNPYHFNLKFVLADALQKLLVLAVLGSWAKLSRSGSIDWMITMFMLATLPNTLVVGVPLITAMYGEKPASIVIQAVVLQSIVWYTLLLFLYEYRSARLLILQKFPEQSPAVRTVKADPRVVSLDLGDVRTEASVGDDGKIYVQLLKSGTGSVNNRDVQSVSSVKTPAEISSLPSTPSRSDLTNVEIYSLHSSRIVTPTSSFNYQDIHSKLGSSPFRATFPEALNTLTMQWQQQPSTDHGSSSCSNLDYDAKELQMFIWSSATSPAASPLRTVRGRTILQEEKRQVASSKEAILEFPEEPGLVKSEEPSPSEAAFQKVQNRSKGNQAATTKLFNTDMPSAAAMIRMILCLVWRKLVRNPNTYASLLGLVWALAKFRWNVELPTIVEGSIEILSDTGLGMAMFSLGLFMALQPRLLPCGAYQTTIGMVLRFVTGPAVMSATCFAVGLHSLELRASILQASLSQGIVPFVFAKQYNVHPDILSTAVIFGLLVSLPITLLYYVLLGL